METCHRQREGDNADELGGQSSKHVSSTTSARTCQCRSAVWSVPRPRIRNGCKERICIAPGDSKVFLREQAGSRSPAKPTGFVTNAWLGREDERDVERDEREDEHDQPDSGGHREIDEHKSERERECEGSAELELPLCPSARRAGGSDPCGPDPITVPPF